MQPRLAQTIAGQIKTRIIDSQMPAGSRLPTEAKLMETYAVSRSTVREAIKILQAENIVEVRHGLGSFVAENTGVSRDPLGLSFTEHGALLPEMLEVRLLMEPDIAALAAKRRLPEDLDNMERQILQMMDAAAKGENYNRYDYGFHIAVAQCTHNTILPRIFPVIYDAIEAGYEQTVNVRGSVKNAIVFHRRILEAIRAGDEAGAREATREHILQTLRDIGQI